MDNLWRSVSIAKIVVKLNTIKNKALFYAILIAKMEQGVCMSEIAQMLFKKHQDKLKSIKEDIDSSHEFFKENYQRFNFFRNYLLRSQLDGGYADMLASLGLPQLEFNVIYPYIARQLGEFINQQPSSYITQKYGTPIDPVVINTLQDMFRHIIDECQKDNTLYNAAEILLTGGFNVFEIFTDYIGDKSMDQTIGFKNTYCPDMCGFDPLAALPHKGDGRYCWKGYVKSKKDFEREFPDVDLSKVPFARKATSGGVSPLQWSYNKQAEDVLLLVDIYYKKKKKEKIVKIAQNNMIPTGKDTMTLNEYNALKEEWEKIGLIEQVPAIIGEPRTAETYTICRYRVIETEVLEYTETDFPELPLVFFGNCTRIRGDDGKVTDFTMPYGWHAKGMQDLKNYAGNSQANELQSIIQHKFIAAEESLPHAEDFKRAYSNIQHADLLIYQAYYEKDSTKPLPAPQIVPRQLVPPIITETFIMADNSIQAIMGSYDAALGINDNQLSGEAIYKGSMQTNAASKPNLVPLIQALDRCFNIMIKMIPKFYNTPRTVPILDGKGNRGFIEINTGKVNFDYDEDALQVKIEPGTNYEMQRVRNMQLLTQTMQASPIFADLINTKGLSVLVDNLPVKGIEQLKPMANQYMQELESAKKQQQQQMKNQQDPFIEQVKVEKEKVIEMHLQNEAKNRLEIARLEIDKLKAETERLKAMIMAVSTHQTNLARKEEHAARTIENTIKTAANVLDMHHKHEKDNFAIKV